MIFLKGTQSFVLVFFKFFLCSVFATLIILWITFPKVSDTEINYLNILISKPAVVVVLETESHIEHYQMAHNTLTCYCQIYGYKLFLIVMDKSPEMQKLCPQKHIWFRRICVPMRILQQNPDINYIFFLDADIGVINPKHKLEEYINPTFDLSFYDRTLTYDIMTGAIIIKNTPYSIQFIEEWLQYEDKFTVAYGGNDQAAVHQMFLNRFYPNHPRKEKCENIWAKADNNTLDGHNGFVGCVRSIMNGTLEFDRIIIYPKASHRAWARDIWLTKSKWAPRDFLLHDMEIYKMTNEHDKLQDFMYYPNPFLSDAVFHSSLCTMPQGLNCWKYNSSFITTDEVVDDMILKKAKEVRQRYLDLIKSL